MLNPDEQVLKAIVALQGPNLQLVLDWIEKSIFDLLNKSITVKEEVAFRWLQGKLQELNDLRKTLQSARELLQGREVVKYQDKKLNNWS